MYVYVLANRIMGKHVNAAEQRVMGQMSTNDAALQTTQLPVGTCPFSGALRGLEPEMGDDESACVIEMLIRDPRVSRELAVNLVMALFRTGIDSVRYAQQFPLPVYEHK